MIIRKKFQFNGKHIVRNCSSDRCKHSIHAHTYEVEVFFTSKGLDNGGMILDFGLMKNNIKEVIKSFDQSYSLWSKESEKFKNHIYSTNKRVVELPYTPSAEIYSLILFFLVDNIIKASEFNNSEKDVELTSVRVHETRSGYAESFRDDLLLLDLNLKDILFSDSIRDSWTDSNMYINLVKAIETDTKCFVNPTPTIQIF